MTKIKHTVQAQRKFALGAVVPAQPERRVEPAPAVLPLPEPRDIQHCGMPASQLLNVIVMRSIHPHMSVSQPVVLLERLNDNKETQSQKMLPKEKKKKKTLIQKESLKLSKQAITTRSLRSQAVNIIIDKKKQERKQEQERKRRRSESSVTDVEDNRPLKFLRKVNRSVPKKSLPTAPPKCRVSLRQLNQRTNKTIKKKPKIIKVVKRRKKESLGVKEASTSRVRPRTVPQTRARPSTSAAPPSPVVNQISNVTADPPIVERTLENMKMLKPIQFRTPRPQRKVRRPDVMVTIDDNMICTELERCTCGSRNSDDYEHCSILSSVIAMGDTEQKPDELERVVADLVDRAQRSPSVQPPACPAISVNAGAGASAVSEVSASAVSEAGTRALPESSAVPKASSSTVPEAGTSALPVAGTSAVRDVYLFNEDADMEAEPSPFRGTRPRPTGSRDRIDQPRCKSVDPVDRTDDTDCILRVLELHRKILTKYNEKHNGKSDANRKDIEKLIKIMERYQVKLLSKDSYQAIAQTKPVTYVTIDDDKPEQEPLDGKPPSDSIGAPTANDEPRTGTSIPSTPADEETVDDDDGPEIAEAPAFYPTKEEMKDLNCYVESIEPVARKYGIFKIVPPRDFQPPCQLKNVQFKSTNQYISSMYSRWGRAAREMTAIKTHLATQNVSFTRPPLFEGVELDLVKLYQLVQEHGGLIRVMEERKWAAIAEKMQLNARAGRVKADVKLDKIFMKYLLPYDTLSEEERKELRERVAASWLKRYERQRARAARPLHRQRRLLGESESEEEDEETEVPAELATAFLEVEDCVVPGANMNLTRFRRVGERVRDMRFPGASAGAPPHWAAVERAYWRLVRTGTEHVCVHGAALDTSQDALGFPAAVDAPYSNHPWNLKRLGKSDWNVLSSLGPTLAVTVPTLHLGMMFSTNCWHHDPHNLPWTEFMHQGPPKIWYGIADSESGAFRAAAEQLCPTAVQNKALWLPSDTAMIPPRLLAARGVRLVRALQAPGEYVVVLPRAFSCSISTGFTVSESLYFAGDMWLDGVDGVFAALRADSEPSMFALEALLEGVARHPGASTSRLLRARALLLPLLQAETTRRRQAAGLGVRALSPRDFLAENRRSSKTSWQVVRDECHICRTTLYWSKIVDVASRVSVCLEHGLHLVELRRANAETDPEDGRNDDFFTILFYSDSEISRLLSDLDKRLSK